VDVKTIKANTGDSGLVPQGRGLNSGRLLTIEQVADLLQVPPSWVYGRTRSRSKERLPGLRLGKYWRFRESEIMDWLDKQGQ
jgi:excisionase family DNA binding protein